MGVLCPDWDSGALRRRDLQSEEGWGACRADTAEEKPQPNPCQGPLSEARNPREPSDGRLWSSV